MKIKTIEIGNFGKLENYKMDFEDGITVIYGNNEDGKSTIMAFIRMMFYGSTGKSGDLSKNIRKKYMPWNGAKMSGAIEFEDNGINYRVEKNFGTSSTTDKVSLWNKTTGEKEMIASGIEIGQRFFGIGAVAFEKSVFISQIGSTISGDGDKEDEITQKLLNLVSTGDEDVSQKKVSDRLRLAKEALKSKSGRIGTLDKLNKRLAILNDERIQALEDEKNKKQMEEQYLELVKEEDKLKNNYEQNKNQYSIQEKLSQLEKLESSISKKQHMDNLLTEYDLKRQQLNAGDKVFDEKFVVNCEEKIAKLKTMERIYEQKAEALKLLKNEMEQLTSNKPCEISKEYVENVRGKGIEENTLQKTILKLQSFIKQISEFAIKKDKGQAALKDSKKKLDIITIEKEDGQKKLEELRLVGIEAEKIAFRAKENLECQKNILSSLIKQKEETNTKYQLAFNNTKYVEKLSSQKIESAKEKLRQASAADKVITNKNAGRNVNKPLLAVSIIIFIFSIILGKVVNSVVYAGTVASIILGIVSLNKHKIEVTTDIVVDEEEVKRAKENLRIVESDSEKEEQAAFEAEKAAEKVLKEMEAQVDTLQSEVLKLEKEYETKDDKLSQIKQQFSELKVKLEFISEKETIAQSEAACEKDELDELLNSNLEIEDMDIQKLKIELEENLSKEAGVRNSIEKLFMDKQCKDVEELQSKYVQWQNYDTKLIAKNEEFEKAAATLKEAEENLEFSRNEILQIVSEYSSVNSIENAEEVIHDLKIIIKEIDTINIKINSQIELIDKDILEKTIYELKQNVNGLREETLKLNNGEELVKCSEPELEQLMQYNQIIQNKLQKIREQLIHLKLTIKNQFAGRKNVSEVENEIYELKEEIMDKEDYYDCLNIAESTLDEAFNEISQSFGPMLNSKTAEIFKSLTAGKYENVMISRNFDINVQNIESAASHEWKYLSGGTIDQAYFALRLSISDLFSEEGTRLPLLLDDVFMQYDEGRTLHGLKFLVDYSQKDNLDSQVIMFTCQRSIVELAKKSSDKIIIKYMQH